MQLALLYGLTQAQARKGEVMVMDVNNGDILCDVALEENNGRNGDFALYCSRVKEVDCIGVKTEENHGYVVMDGMRMIPLRFIMPAVSYLAFMEYGFQPTDLLEWDENSITIEDAFTEGYFEPLINAVMQLFPEGVDELAQFMINLGIIPLIPNINPRDLDEIMCNEYYGYALLDWFNLIALEKEFVKHFLEEGDKPGCLSVRPDSVRLLKDVLKKNAAEFITSESAYKANLISGYNCMLEEKDYSEFYLFGYFPSDVPKYGIMVWMDKQKTPEYQQDQEYQDVGENLAWVCNRMFEFLMRPETNK